MKKIITRFKIEVEFRIFREINFDFNLSSNI